MDLFDKFKEAVKAAVERLQDKTGAENKTLLAFIEASADWQALEKRLVALRTLSRKRQQEILERCEPLAQRVEALTTQAESTQLKIVRRNLLRQADQYMRELESEDEAAKVHNVNCRMLTDVISHIRRAQAMGDRGIDAGVVDSVTAGIEELVEEHESAVEAVSDLESAAALEANPTRPSRPRVEENYESVAEEVGSPNGSREDEEQLAMLGKRLFAEQA